MSDGPFLLIFYLLLVWLHDLCLLRPCRLARVVGGLLRWFFYARIVGLWLLGGFVLFGLLPVPIFIGEVLSIFSLPGYGFR